MFANEMRHSFSVQSFNNVTLGPNAVKIRKKKRFSGKP
jgi:hypothetical protein